MRAKFVCNSVKKSFFTSTPSGSISVSSFNSEDYFEPGKEYYIDFSKGE
jgi:hypothetical protein